MEAYSIYLMVSLAQASNVMEKELEYDLAWGQGGELLLEFEASDFNVDTKSEYECILEFLETKDKIEPTTFCAECGGHDVETKEWVHQHTGRISNGGVDEDEDTWCNTCQGHHGIV